MDETHVFNTINALGELRQKIAVLEQTLSDEEERIRNKHEAYRLELEATTSPILEEMERLGINAEMLETTVREGVLTIGKTVKGVGLQALFIPGKPSWNNDALEGYAIAHPEILPFKSVGKPFVQIRKVAK
jgi:hypothetical protein